MKRPAAPDLPNSRPGTKPAQSTSTQSKPATKPLAANVDPASIQAKAQQLSQKLADERRHAAWLSGFRFSAFSLVMAVILVIGVLSLIPRVQELVTQRQQIDALQTQLSQTLADTTAKQAQREQWNDRTFVETQAREQLYFVEPGDVSYLVINDLQAGELTQANQNAATSGVQQTRTQWLGTLLNSVWVAGSAQVSPAPAATEPAPAAQ